MMRNNTATAQVAIASVRSQLLMSCHAGKVKRKKFSGLPKIGSATLPVACGAYQNSASVGHSAINAKPVTPAKTMETPKEMTRRAGWTDRLIGCSCDDDCVSPRQIGLMRPSNGRKCAVQNQKRGPCKNHEVRNLQSYRFPEDLAVSKRLEPEKVNPIRQSDPSTEEDS